MSIETHPKDVEGLITRNQELEDLKKAMLNLLEDLEEANTHLAQERNKLKSRKEELEKVNKELDNFVYIVSHDLRSPLSAISSFATFLKEDYKEKLDADGKEYIDEIREGAYRLNDLIEDLLTLSRISRIKNPYEPVNIKDLLESVTETLKHDIHQHEVQLTVTGNMPVVICDRIKMAQVFQNLINNAIKFSSKNEKEKPRMEIGCIERQHAFEFYVQDNGIGIDPQFHDQVFGVFKRLHTEKEFEGTGVGLSIVKRVIDDHGGRVWIESQLGQGARFLFTIPKIGASRTILP